jgi:uncharacterized protein (DUF427 family)
MMRATWNNAVLAESAATIVIEGNHYFPVGSVNQKFLQKSATHTTCAWKGVASYYSLSVDGKLNADAAWYYPAPLPAAQEIKDYVAFWRGVVVASAE